MRIGRAPGCCARIGSWVAAGLLAAVGSPLIAQTPPTPAAAVVCRGESVSSVEILREPPRLLGRSVPEWARTALAVLVQHRTTTASAITPFLLLREGERCTEHARAETERLLRAQPYLATATVRLVPDDTGTVRVVVSTVDEIPLVLGARVYGGRLSGATYGSGNVLGLGVAASASWRDGLAYRDGFGMRLTHYHLLGTTNRLDLRLERHPLGSDRALVVERPYLTARQRVAWHAGLRVHDGYVTFFRGADAPLSLNVDRRRLDLGAVFRVGSPELGMFAGPYLVREGMSTGHAVVVTDTGLVADADTTLASRYAPVRSTRVAGVAGVRWLSYQEAVGLDGLVGTQDIARGLQAAVAVGNAFEDGTRGLFVATDIYLGAGTPRSFTALRVIWEGVQPEGEVTPHDVVASGRLAWYRKPRPQRTWITSMEFAGSWRGRIPFQLALDEPTGVRGYRASRLAGARRAVARTEHRRVLFSRTRAFALGGAVFGEVGQTWRGDHPFGRTSGVRPAGGVGLLLAVPRESRRLLRLDFAVPLSPDPNAAGYEVRLTTAAPLRAFWRDPPVIQGIRMVTPPGELVGWP